MTQGSKNALFPKPQTPLLVKIPLPSECGVKGRDAKSWAAHTLPFFGWLCRTLFSITSVPVFHQLTSKSHWKLCSAWTAFGPLYCLRPGNKQYMVENKKGKWTTSGVSFSRCYRWEDAHPCKRHSRLVLPAPLRCSEHRDHFWFILGYVVPSTVSDTKHSVDGYWMKDLFKEGGLNGKQNWHHLLYFYCI